MSRTSEPPTVAEPVLGEEHRPALHFTPPSRWMNDPNGLAFHDGWYHLYYQYNPNSRDWGTIHWGHARSRDLLTWEHRPIALTPDFARLGHVASGSVVFDRENTSGLGRDGRAPLVAMYSNFPDDGPQVQSLSFSLDGGETWTEDDHNPVIENPGIADFRDPKVLRFDDHWVMVLAADQVIQFYVSDDLRSWRLTQDFGEELGHHDGSPWECPDLIPLIHEGRTTWLLIVSVQGSSPNGGSGVQYFLGDFDGERFHYDGCADTRWLDFGPDQYATVSWHGVEPPLIVGWMSNWAYGREVPTAPWRGAMGLPRHLELITTPLGLRSAQRPVDSLIALRQQPAALCDGFALGRDRTPVDIELEVSTQARLTLRSDRGDALSVDVSQDAIHLDRSNARSLAQMLTPAAKAPRLGVGARVRLIIDRSTIEVFADHGTCVLSALYFAEAPWSRIELRGDASGTVWKLR